jgi:hypothetical protein
MMHTTDAIDYAVEHVAVDGEHMVVSLSRRGDMPMPQDVTVTWEDGSVTRMHIPLVMMRGHRPLGPDELLGADWPWVDPTYEVTLPTLGRRALRVALDEAGLLADVDRSNNAIEFDLTKTQEGRQSN